MSEAIMGQWIAAGSGLLGVLIGSAITVANDQLAQHAERQRRARYLAMRTVIALESFVSSCASTLEPDPLVEDEGPYTKFSLPEPLQIPSDVDWTSIKSDVAFSILALPGADITAREGVHFTANVADSWAAQSLRDEKFTELGLRAHAIAEKLRSNYSLGVREIGEWDPVERLTERLEKLRKRPARAAVGTSQEAV